MSEKTPAPVGAAVALDLAEIEARFADATADEVIYELWPALVAEVRRLTRLGQCDLDLLMRAEAAEAEVVTLRARLAAVVDEYPHADTCGSMLTPGAGYPCSCWQADLRAALATTGEGE